MLEHRAPGLFVWLAGGGLLEGGMRCMDGDHSSGVFGRTPVGRATVAGLKLNRPVALAIRSEEAERGRHPSPAG